VTRAVPAHVREFRKLTPDQRQAWTSFLRTASRILTELNTDLERSHGITLSAYDVLVMLSLSGEDGVSIGELSEHLLLSQSGMSRNVERLERDGLVERVAAARDNRRRIARITDAGLAKLAAATPDHLRAVRTLFLDKLTPEQTRVIGEAFGAVQAD